MFGEPDGAFEAIILQEVSGGSFQFLRYLFVALLSPNCLESQIAGQRHVVSVPLRVTCNPPVSSAERDQHLPRTMDAAHGQPMHIVSNEKGQEANWSAGCRRARPNPGYQEANYCTDLANRNRPDIWPEFM